MCFSHLYNLTKSSQHKNTNDYEEDYEMGAYGDNLSGGSNNSPKKSYDEDYDHRGKYKEEKKEDPFAWDNPKPTKTKDVSRERSRSNEEENDTGYDGWNDVKKSKSHVQKSIPDPYSKPQNSSPKKQSNNDDYFANYGDTRGKATTVVNKQKEYFSSEYDKPTSAKKKDFDETSQPKSFNFDDFGKTVEKKNDFDDFDNAFDGKPNKETKKDDTFAWDDSAKNTKQDSNGFEFDFDAGQEKAENKPEKKDEMNFLDDQQVEKPKEEFDPFANNNDDQNRSNGAIDSLVDIKFDPVIPPPTFEHQPKSADPVIQTENEIQSDPKRDPKRDPGDLWSKKELFNLDNISKIKQSKLEIHKDQNNDNTTFGNNHSNPAYLSDQFSAPVGGSFPTSFNNQPKAPETKEDKLNALESAFGSSEVQQIHQVHQPPQQPPQQQKTNNDDFGEFPSMFGASADGFGTFKGFESDTFEGDNNNFSAPTQTPAATPPPAPVVESKPNQEKKDDWFEF